MYDSTQPSSFFPVNIKELRSFFTKFASFSGSWAANLEGWERGGSTASKLYFDNGLAEKLHGGNGLAHFQYISTGAGYWDKHVLVSYNWQDLVARVKVDALKYRMGML